LAGKLAKRALFAALLLAVQAAGAWEEAKSGPFIVISERGGKQIRETLAELEQFRGALGQAVGKDNLKTVWPITVVLDRGAPAEAFLGMSRDGWIAFWPEKSRPSDAWFRQLALLLLEDSLPGQMTLSFEDAIAEAYSTLQIDGARLTFGAPPPARERTWQWALIHQLTVNEDTRGRIRVLMSNLANGGDFDASLRNSFQRTRADIEQEAKAYAARTSFETTAWSGFGINPDRFRLDPSLPSRVRLIPGDLALGRARYAESVAVYEKAQKERPSTAGFEGLGLALAGLGRKDQALSALGEVAADETGGARGLLELAKLEPGREESRLAVERASLKKPDWAEPFIFAATQEPGPVRKAYLLKKAVELAPRRVDLYEQLAAAQTAAGQFDEATKSWRAAIRVAGSEQARAELLERQRAAETARLDAAEAARRKQQQEDRDEVDKLKREAEERIRAAEKRVNESSGGLKSSEKPLDWWDGPALEKAEGRLLRVECVGKAARLVIGLASGKTLRLNVPDPSKVVVMGTGEATLACGVSKSPREVRVEYQPKRDAKAATAGEAVMVEFK
jgi:tetratricopeptide (TPR) repeat protein